MWSTCTWIHASGSMQPLCGQSLCVLVSKRRRTYFTRIRFRKRAWRPSSAWENNCKTLRIPCWAPVWPKHTRNSVQWKGWTAQHDKGSPWWLQLAEEASTGAFWCLCVLTGSFSISTSLFRNAVRMILRSQFNRERMKETEPRLFWHAEGVNYPFFAFKRSTFCRSSLK